MATDLGAGSIFDPTAHPVLRDLGERLRDLAGDASYKAGRDYHKKGSVRNGAVAGTTAYATVSGSTDYRVSVSFADEPKVSCTCPAHRRNRFCKHVVALCVALLERPAEFARVEPAPEAPKAPRPRKERAAPSATAETTIQARGAGLETVGSLLDALAMEGLVALGADKLALLANVGELVRARKLRRLGNRILALQRAAEGANGEELDPASFARLLADLDLTCRATLAHLEGRIALDAAEAEDLLGKTWRDSDLEPVAGLELVELGAQTFGDVEFRVEIGTFVDMARGDLYQERQITPVRLAGAPRVRQRCRLLVDEARLYPGPPPRRIRFGRVRRAPLTLDDVECIVALALDEVPALHRRLVEHLEDPFADPTVPVLFRPAALVGSADRFGALDRAGRFVALEWPKSRADDLPKVLPSPGAVALLGDLGLAETGSSLRCRSLIGALAWDRGPIYPEEEKRR